MAPMASPSRERKQMKSTLEDLAQHLSKILKDASKIRVRRSTAPDLTPIQCKVEASLETKVILATAPEGIVSALKDVAAAMRKVVRMNRDPSGGPPPLNNPDMWRNLEAVLLEPFEELAGRMRTAGLHVPQVRNFKLARSLYHSASSLLVVLCGELLWTSRDMMVVSATACACAWFSEYLKLRSEGFRRFMFSLLGAISRDGEQHNVNSATWYMSALMCLSFLFGKLPSGLGALALGVGDPAAALVGSKLGSIKVYGKKTMEGSGAFVLVSFAFSVGYMRGLYQLEWPAVLSLAAVAAVSGSIAELFCPVPTVDDNLFVPLATAAAVSYFLHSFGGAVGCPGGATPYSEVFDWAGVGAQLPWGLGALLYNRLPPPGPGIFKGTWLEFIYPHLPEAPLFA
mmetsp:Transcript_2732/g.6111  ORF Transcript_2732/g.6111 Transcript_2732/m.6111 type:complete len:399 (+) Transcript_2732:155-1351(+)